MTSEIERVRQWFASGRLLAPVGDVPSTVHLSRALAQLCENPNIPEDEQAAALAAAIGPARQLRQPELDDSATEKLRRFGGPRVYKGDHPGQAHRTSRPS